jgi:acylphosphatase
MKRVRLIIFGDVQAVGFRFSAIEVARDLGLTGWVRNNPNGTVEIVAEASRDWLENFITWAKKGPPLAKVTDVEIDWEQATGEFSEFTVGY